MIEPTYDFSGLTHLAFDADDTLWECEQYFVDAKARCTEILADYLPAGADLERELYTFERRNLGIFGYGTKGFTLSLIETAVALSRGQISGADIQRIIDLGKEMLAHPVRLLPDVAATLDRLAPRFTLLCVTKGDLFDQESKLARSGLADRFASVDIVSEKDEATYTRLFARRGLDPARLLMVGNSLASDVLPVIAAGARAVHLPHHVTWHHEQRTPPPGVPYWTAPDLPTFADRLLAANAET